MAEAEEREQARERVLMALEDRHRMLADVAEDGVAAHAAVESLRIIGDRTVAAYDEWERLSSICLRTHKEPDVLWRRYRIALLRQEGVPVDAIWRQYGQ